MTYQTDQIESLEEDYLYVDESQITDSGNGLYTAVEIFQEEYICQFKGERLSFEEADRRIATKQDQYFINLLDGTILDSKEVDCFAKYANDAAGPGLHSFENNAHIGLDEQNNICLIADRNIKAGEEIFCAYGKAYWKKHGA